MAKPDLKMGAVARDPQQESSAQWKGPEEVLAVRKARSSPYWEDSKPPALLEPAPLASPWQPRTLGLRGSLHACSNRLDSQLGFESMPGRLAEQQTGSSNTPAVEFSCRLATGGEAAGF